MSEWWQTPNPMGGFLGSGVRGGAPLRPSSTPLPPPPSPSPAPKRVQRAPKPVAVAVAPEKPRPDRSSLGVPLGTIRGVILRAACELAAGSTLTRLPLADIVVRAWRLDPARLGLRGYEDHHPDANRVYAKLSGTEGLVALGLLERTGDGIVSVTRKGLAWWRQVRP